MAALKSETRMSVMAWVRGSREFHQDETRRWMGEHSWASMGWLVVGYAWMALGVREMSECSDCGRRRRLPPKFCG